MFTPEVGLAPCYAANTAIVYDLHFLKYRRVYRHEFLLIYLFIKTKQEHIMSINIRILHEIITDQSNMGMLRKH